LLIRIFLSLVWIDYIYYSANVADEILSVLNKFNGSPYIREVITTNPQKPPAVICHTDEQLKLMNAKNDIMMLDIRQYYLQMGYETMVSFKIPIPMHKNWTR
jgi:hypothetical protein